MLYTGTDKWTDILTFFSIEKKIKDILKVVIKKLLNMYKKKKTRDFTTYTNW